MSFPQFIIETINPLLILPIGIAISFVGFGPLSRRKNPTASTAFLTAGLIFRLAGAVLIAWGAFYWIFVFSMAFGGR
jgi:hypothetical protein